jgi:TPR repeat protein
MSRWVYVSVALAVVAASNAAPAFADYRAERIQELEAKCGAGNGFECKKLGVTYNMRYPGPPEPVKARGAYEKGCKLKDSEACALLYEMLALGKGGPQDLARAKKLEEAACNHPRLGITSALRASGLCLK